MVTSNKGRKKDLCKYLMMLLGTAISAFGIYNVHHQSYITEGGILGSLLLLNHWFGITPAILSPILDLLCYGLAFKYLGKDFLKKAIFATLGFASFYALYECFPPVFAPFYDRPLHAAVLGAIFIGVGVGIVVRMGGAAGGDDALAMVIMHWTKQPIEKCYLFTDLTVLALSLSYIPFQKIIYSLITVTISSYIIGFIHTFKISKK